MSGKEININMEVVKFGVVLGVNLVTLVGAYFKLEGTSSEALELAKENAVTIEMMQRANIERDLETVRFRENMTNRVHNIESLTQDIHNAVIGD